MRTLQSVFLIAAIAIPSTRNETSRIGYVYCPSGNSSVPITTVYSSPPMSIPVGTLNCGNKVQVLGRKEFWVRIASTEGERYVPMTALSRRNDRFAALDLPLPPEPRPTDQRTGEVLPRVISSPNPEYSQNALKAGIHGFVILKLTIGADGNAHDMSVAQGLGYGLDESAMKAVQSWKFEPALQNGVPVDFKGEVALQFPPKSN